MKPYFQDKWVTIYHGDCREILPQLDVKVDLVLTDPPYGICEEDGKVQMRGEVVEPDYKEWDTFDKDWIHLLPLKADSSIVVFHDQKQATILWQTFIECGIRPSRYLFWDKGDSGINPRHNFVNTIEMALFGNRGNYTWNCNGSTINLFRKNRIPTPLHPTQKPEILFQSLIGWLSNSKNLILDPFLGSGTTCYCAKKLSRYSIGIEIEEKYCEAAARRCCQEVMELV